MGRHTTPRLRANKALSLIVGTVLLRAGDIELNPGPTQSQSCLCSVCNKKVTWAAKALQCDECDNWTHSHCIPISDDTYSELGNSSNLWFCPNCGPPNSSDLINTYNIAVSNPFSILNAN